MIFVKPSVVPVQAKIHSEVDGAKVVWVPACTGTAGYT